MTYSPSQPFCKKWMFASMVIFFVTELVLGGVIGQLVVGKMLSHNSNFLVQGLLNVSSYFFGGIIVGLVSPGIRIYEPAAGAFLSVALTLTLTIFSPYSYLRFSVIGLLVGGGIAFWLALVGAKLGERLSGNKLPSK